MWIEKSQSSVKASNYNQLFKLKGSDMILQIKMYDSFRVSVMGTHASVCACACICVCVHEHVSLCMYVLICAYV